MSENNKKINCLIKLQSVITEKLNLENQSEMIPNDLKSDQESLKKANALYIQTEELLKNAEDEEKTLFLNYSDAELQKTEYEKLVETLSTQKEYDAMSKQILDCQTKADLLMKARKAKNAEINELRAKLEQIKNDCALYSERVNAAEKEYDDNLSQIKEKIVLLNAQCEEIKGDTISDDLYNRFCNIAKKKGGEGLVPVKGQVCMGCNTVLPMQFVIDLRLKQYNDEVDTCPYCSRMIYFDDNLTPDEEKNYIFDDIDTIKNLGKSSDILDSDDASLDDDILVSDDSQEEDDEF